MLIKEAQLIQQKGSIINRQFDCFPNILKLYTKLENFQSRLNKNETVKNFDLDLLDNNEEFIDGVLYTSTPIPNTTIDYMQRLEKYTEKVNSNVTMTYYKDYQLEKLNVRIIKIFVQFVSL